jgi:hypothetical protein
MRQVILTLLATLLCVAMVRPAHSTEPASAAPAALPLQSLTCPDALLRRCCDCYCSKPQPSITCFCRGCCGFDYCRKPCPCVSCFHGGCGECYCRKACPDLCRPLAADYFFICVGSGDGGVRQYHCQEQAGIGNE